MNIASFVKERRKQLKLTQTELAMRAGVGLRFVRELGLYPLLRNETSYYILQKSISRSP